MSKTIGKIIQVIGPVIDVSFEEAGNELPNIYEALEVERPNVATAQPLIAHLVRKKDPG